MKEIKKLALAGAITSLFISLPLMNISLIILLSLSYMFFIFCPFIFLIDKIKTGFLEKFFLANISGLSYSMIYVILDVFFSIPLTRITFILITLIIYILSYYLSKSIKK
jgi:hypothetical protein